MMELSCWEGRRRWRPWMVRQVTSTRAPPSGTKRRWRLMPINSRKRKAILSLAVEISSRSRISDWLQAAVYPCEDLLREICTLPVGDGTCGGRPHRAAPCRPGGAALLSERVHFFFHRLAIGGEVARARRAGRGTGPDAVQ